MIHVNNIVTGVMLIKIATIKLLYCDMSFGTLP